MKKSLLFATAILALASCTNETYLGTAEEKAIADGQMPISFGFDVPAATRADHTGVDAATALGNYFVVYGEKGETSKAKYSDGNLVFPNYTVHYSASTAYTTTSNTKNWEYVGETPISTTYVKMNDGSADVAAPSEQTIKYWDYGAGTYTYTAVSAKKEDIEDGRVTIQKNTVGADNVYQKGYTITLAKTSGSPDVYPEVNKLYFSDRKVITKSTGTNRETPNAYGGNVTLTFRNLVSHIRAGVYETIPGYDITEIKFYVNGDNEAQVSSTSAFGAICPNTKTSNYEGTITVEYYTAADETNHVGTENQPKVTQSETPATDLVLGTNMSTISTASDNQLGKAATSPTWDTSGGTFTEVFPQINNSTDLQLKCNYKLWNSVTGEIINVTGATARIPAKYLRWKPNFKYTYLFKISDDTNGHAGGSSDPAGLYPITFDAVEVIAEDGQAEYITTVSEPTITTFGVNSTTGKYVVGGSEYAAGSDIYATFTEGSTVKTPTLGGSGAQHVNVFKVTTPDATNFPITEASVAEAIANPGSITNNVYTCTVAYTKVTDASTLAGSTNYYKADSESRVPGTTGYVATLAVSETDYHVDATPANSTMAVDIYTVAVSSVTEVTDATTLAAGTTYYRADGSSVAPGGANYVPTVAVEGTDYEVAPKIKAVNINSDASTNFSAAPAAVTTVPGEDGINITIDALKLTGVKAGTYAIEYTASAAWTGTYTKVYKIIVVQ